MTDARKALADNIQRCKDLSADLLRAAYDKAKPIDRDLAIGVAECVAYLLSTRFPLPGTREEVAREPLPDIPYKIWADKIENTTRTSIVRAQDRYGSELRMAHIECFYDFEAKRLVALLRVLAALPPAPMPERDGMRETLEVPAQTLRALSEVVILIDEYDPSNSDWQFRKGVIKTLLDRAALAPHDKTEG